ncbi:MAG: ABC transporter permease [Peptococcaceae bacterium]|nr:ABC transporter permease [Peptococcaceae bacterium]
MDFVRRGVVSVIRKPGKALILLILVLILGTLIAGAISVRQAVDHTERGLRATMSPATIVSYDHEKLRVFFEQDAGFVPEALSVETIEKIGALSQVKSYDYSARVSLESRSLRTYDSGEGYVMGTSYFSLKGVSNPNLIDLLEGKIELDSGRVFYEEEIKNLTYVALVSANFAGANNLAVGSKMSLENNVYEMSGEPIYWGPDGMMNDIPIAATQPYEFEIIGIFKPVKQIREDSGGKIDFQWLDYEAENRIYVPNRVINEAAAFQNREIAKLNPEIEAVSNMYYEPLYVLNDPLDVGAFREAVAVLTPDYYTVIDTAGSFDQVAAPMKSLQSIAGIVLFGAVAVALIILSLVVTLFLRDRKREIGIYLSLGERKSKVAGQIVLEVVVVSAVAILLSLFAGNLLSGAVSEKVLIDRLAAEQSSLSDLYGHSVMYTELDMMGYQSTFTGNDILESYGVSLSWGIVLLFFGVGIGTVCLSTLIPIMYVLRLNPKKILM